jgi:hypothetical protein
MGVAPAAIGDQLAAQVPVQVLVGGVARSFVYRYRVNPSLVMTVPANVSVVEMPSGDVLAVLAPMGAPFPTGSARLAGTSETDVPQAESARGAARSRAATPARHEGECDMQRTVGTLAEAAGRC